MNKAILMKNNHTVQHSDVLAFLVSYSKLITIANNAIELRKTYYDSIEVYQSENCCGETDQKLVEDDKKQKVATNTLKTVALITKW